MCTTLLSKKLAVISRFQDPIVIRYKVYSEQHSRAGLNIQHVIYEQLARAGRNTERTKVREVNYKQPSQDSSIGSIS